MKLQINTKLFGLDEIYPNLNYGKTLLFADELRDIRKELKTDLSNQEASLESNVDEVKLINLQLEFVNQNIETFTEALSLHESETYEVISLFGKNNNIWLN